VETFKANSLANVHSFFLEYTHIHAYAELLICLLQHVQELARKITLNIALKNFSRQFFKEKFHTACCVIDADIHDVENGW
jgi:hypothetical protein